MNWMFVTHRFPWPIIHGRWLRVYHLVRTLCEQGDQVSVLSRHGDKEGVEEYTKVGVTVIDGPQGAPLTHGPARCWLGPYVFDAGMAKAVARYADQFDVVVLSGPVLLQYAREASSGGRVVAEFVDDPMLELRRRFWHTRSPRLLAQRLKSLIGRPKYERTFLEPVAVTTFVSEQDCESFSRRHPGRRVAFVPNGVDIEYFRRLNADSGKSTSVPTITFTGHMSNPNNEWAAVFLVQRIAPIIWKTHPDVRIQIVGADPADAVLALAGPKVEVTGRVSDIRPYLWGADVMLLPMQSGTGIKNKLLEAWAAGSAVVATPLACQGVPGGDGKNLLLGSTPLELAKCATRLLADERLRSEMAAEGQRTVWEHLTWHAVAKRLRQVVAGVDSDPKAVQ